MTPYETLLAWSAGSPIALPDPEDTLAEMERLHDALYAIVRAHRTPPEPGDCCTVECASGAGEDCDCGYVEAADDLVGWGLRAMDPDCDGSRA